MGFKFRKDGGDDGGSMDEKKISTFLPKTKVQGVPQLLSATARCGCCGTSDQLSGKPDTRVDYFKCRTCKNSNDTNNGNGFRFQGWN